MPLSAAFADIVEGQRLGFEFRIGGRRRQCLMHLRRPQAEPPHVRHIDCEFLMSGAIALPRCKGRRLEDALQSSEGPGPGIALVAHEGLQDREHGVVFLAVDMFDNAEQRRGIGEMRDFGQEAQGLDFGVGAGF